MSREVCGICWCPFDEKTGDCACPPANVQKSTLREAAQQALEALEWNLAVIEDFGDKEQLHRQHKAITALRAALAEPVQDHFPDITKMVQEPAGWLEGPFGEFRANQLFKHSWPAQTVAWSIPLYLAPPQRKPLTEEEIYSLFRTSGSPTAFARAIERAHGIE